MDADATAMLNTILRELHELRVEVRAQRERPSITPADHDLRCALLRALAERTAGSVFASSELAADALRPGNILLHDAIVRANGSLNPRHLGKLLRALEGIDFDGLRVVRCGIDRTGVVWCVVKVA